jgi:hypothetical protein
MSYRSSASPLSPRRLVPGAAVLLLLLTIIPGQWTRWTTSVGSVVEFLVSPVQGPVTQLVAWLRGPTPLTLSPDEAELRRGLAEAQTAYRQVADENDRLRVELRNLQRGWALVPDAPVRQLVASVIGQSTNLAQPLIKVRAGSVQGLPAPSESRSFAVHDGVFLVGPLVDVGQRVSWIMPLTTRDASARKPEAIQGIIFTNERLSRSSPDAPPEVVTTQLAGVPVNVGLEPVGNGTLQGLIFTTDPSLPVPEIEDGMVVRLRDSRESLWPRHAQMLIVGVVESRKPQPNGRVQVVVRPLFDAQRLANVIIRAEAADDARPTTRQRNGGNP